MGKPLPLGHPNFVAGDVRACCPKTKTEKPRAFHQSDTRKTQQFYRF